MKNKKIKLLIQFQLIFSLLISLGTAGCRAGSSLPVKYLTLKQDFDEQTLYNFFSNLNLLKEARKFFSVKESSDQKEKAKSKLIELAPAQKKEKVKEVFAQFSSSSPPSIPILIAEGRFKGENALFLVEVWALDKEKTFRWVRLWVFQEENLRLLYALSFKNPS